jgi:hypothetical protein
LCEPFFYQTVVGCEYTTQTSSCPELCELKEALEEFSHTSLKDYVSQKLETAEMPDICHGGEHSS